jgi:hypothetical protein
MTQYTLGLTRLLGHGRAFTEVVAPATPAAGAGFVYTVSQYWEVSDSLAFRLVTDANAANRQVTVNVNDGGGVLLASFSAAAVQTAGLTRDYVFLPNLNAPSGPTVGIYYNPWYQGLLQPGFNITCTVGAVQVGDQISRIRLNQERFVTGEEGYLLGVIDDTDPRFAELVAAQAVLA